MTATGSTACSADPQVCAVNPPAGTAVDKGTKVTLQTSRELFGP